MKKNYFILLLSGLFILFGITSCSDSIKTGMEADETTEEEIQTRAVPVAVYRIFSTYANQFDQQFVPADQRDDKKHRAVYAAIASQILAEGDSESYGARNIYHSVYHSWRIVYPVSSGLTRAVVNDEVSEEILTRATVTSFLSYGEGYKKAFEAIMDANGDDFATMADEDKIVDVPTIIGRTSTGIPAGQIWNRYFAMNNLEENMPAIDAVMNYREDDAMLIYPRPWANCFTIEDGYYFMMDNYVDYEDCIELINVCLPPILSLQLTFEEKLNYYNGLLEKFENTTVQRYVSQEMIDATLRTLAVALYAHDYWTKILPDVPQSSFLPALWKEGDNWCVSVDGGETICHTFQSEIDPTSWMYHNPENQVIAISNKVYVTGYLTASYDGGRTWRQYTSDEIPLNSPVLNFPSSKDKRIIMTGSSPEGSSTFHALSKDYGNTFQQLPANQYHQNKYGGMTCNMSEDGQTIVFQGRSNTWLTYSKDEGNNWDRINCNYGNLTWGNIQISKDGVFIATIFDYRLMLVNTLTGASVLIPTNYYGTTYCLLLEYENGMATLAYRNSTNGIRFIRVNVSDLSYTILKDMDMGTASTTRSGKATDSQYILNIEQEEGRSIYVINKSDFSVERSLRGTSPDEHNYIIHSMSPDLSVIIYSDGNNLWRTRDLFATSELVREGIKSRIYSVMQYHY